MTTDQIAKAPDQAKAALAQAIDQSTGLDLMTLSTVMVQSGFFPNVESVAQGVVKILAGRELGFPAIASLRHIYVHNGHIGLQATLIATQIRRSGTYDYRIVESSDTKCEIEFLRKVENAWRPEGKAGFTIDEAKRAGLVRDKSAWQTYPSDLLFARAMTRGQRRYCPDVFGQTVYSEEEVREIEATEPKLAGGQTFEERIAEMMPREKAPESPADDTPASPADHAPVTADAPPSQSHTPAPPAAAGESGSEAAAGVPLHSQNDNYKPMTAVEVKGAQPDLPAGQPEPKPPKRILEFKIGTQVFHTAGVTRNQLKQLFDICPKVGKKCGAAKPREVLIKEFGVAHRDLLTEEAADRYLVRMTEMLEG